MNEIPAPDPADDSQNIVRKDRLSVVVHDLRHCLHVLKMGLTLLKVHRANEDQFAEICATMESEERDALSLLEELVQFARGEK